MAEDHNVDNHPDNNISHLPTESPADGTEFGPISSKNSVNAGGRVPDYKGDADAAKQEISIVMKYRAGGNDKRFSDIGLNPPGKGSLRNLDYNKAR